jgi:hypothetical protein
MSNDATSQDTDQPRPRWQPLVAADRRVIGVLIEKAKTTPNAYPMSLNAVVTGANQKSNRSPVMQLDPDDVEESLDRLRVLGAVGLIEGYGRVNKYRHYMYDWLAVDKVEIAVMGELLLRGAQTIGELRGRAARMEPIRDLAELLPVVQSLIDRGLVVSLTPEGRGQVVTHALYQPREMERLAEQYRGAQAGQAAAPAAPRPTGAARPAASTATPGGLSATAPQDEQAPGQTAEALRREIQELRDQVAQLRCDLDEITIVVERTGDQLGRLKDELGV